MCVEPGRYTILARTADDALDKLWDIASLDEDEVQLVGIEPQGFLGVYSFTFIDTEVEDPYEQPIEVSITRTNYTI